MRTSLHLFFVVSLVLLTGCVTVPPKDYTEFRKSRPASILVLPPVNHSSDVRATYSVFTTTTRPVAELGYYVFPVVMVDHMLKENGLTMPDEMHAVPVAKFREIFGADAILYITIEQYGSKYMVIASSTIVQARAKLVDARTEKVIWENFVRMDNGGQSGLVQALVEQVLNKLTDQAHNVAVMASYQLLTLNDKGLLKGPRHPEFSKPEN